MYSRRTSTPPTMNTNNNLAITKLIEAYDICKTLSDRGKHLPMTQDHKFACSNALTALRGCYVNGTFNTCQMVQNISLVLQMHI